MYLEYLKKVSNETYKLWRKTDNNPSLIFQPAFGKMNDEQRDYYIKNEIILYTIFFWILILIVSFFSINKLHSFQEAIIFIRILIIPIFLSLWILENEKTLNRKMAKELVDRKFSGKKTIENKVSNLPDVKLFGNVKFIFLIPSLLPGYIKLRSVILLSLIHI